MSSRNNPARVAIVMGSKSDWATMQFAAEIFEILDVPHHVEVVSAHRTPDKLFSFAETAEDNGYQVIIAGAGGAAHLPGMIAAKTLIPVLGVPVQSAALSGVDSLLLHCADAARHSGGYTGDRQSRGGERRAAGSANFGYA
ncbi:phosphoribosylaminoimidazole carboxylase catalytic subunit [Salmonella enterica subsp. diarizonae]|nr:phosphoribosylaminoimidazole carboxylase catalytic subunit [Salmonella enterica subsp. diarizonae]